MTERKLEAEQAAAELRKAVAERDAYIAQLEVLMTRSGIRLPPKTGETMR